MKDDLGFPKALNIRISCWGRGIRGGWEQRHPRVEPVVGEKRAQSGGRMLRIVIAEFCHGEEAGPVGLLVVAIDAQVLFQHRIEPLRLAIRLGMERRGPVGADPTQLQQPTPEVRSETRSLSLTTDSGRP